MTDENIQPLNSKKEKILVCITIQKNSLRLIKKGADLAEMNNGEFHILHVEKGNSIFPQNGVTELTQELFKYASRLGGEVHLHCSNNVPNKIVEFCNENDITRLVIGETMRSKLHRLILKKDIENYVTTATNEVEIIVFERNKNKLKIKNEEAFSS